MAETPANPPKPPDSPQLAALKNENAILEQQLTQTQTQQKLISTMLPSIGGTPLEGTVKLDGDHPVESQIIAYHSVSRLGGRIAQKVKGANAKQVVIHSDAEIAGLLALQAFVDQMVLMGNALKRETADAKSTVVDAREATKGAVAQIAAAPMVALVAGAVIRSAVDLLSLFKKDVSLKYQSITIDDLALVAAVAGHLASLGILVLHPSVVPPLLFAVNSTVLDRLKELNGAYAEMDVARKDAEAIQSTLKTQIADLAAKITAAEQAQTNSAPLKSAQETKQAALDRLTALEARLAAAATAFESFQQSLVKADDAGGSALSRLLRAEKLSAAAGADSHILFLKVLAAGGAFRTKQSKFSSGELAYSGGAIVEYILYAPTGVIAAAGTLPEYSGFVKVKDRDESSTDLSEFCTG